LGYAVSPTGADHMHNYWDGGQANSPLGERLQSLGIYVSVPQTDLSPHKVRAYLVNTNWTWLGNHLGLCAFIPWTTDQTIQLVRTITGWQTNLYELLQIAERGVTMARVFNLREGKTREDDVLPQRMAKPHVSGTLNEKPVTPEALDEALTLFYGMMGWDPETGQPTQAKLHELDIAWVGEA
jgi:aldehyde:ferredoxin oxidoreductase